MTASAEQVSLETIRSWRDLYRQEMSCQIIFDSLHARPGWSRENALSLDGTMVGYGSVAIAGPWTDRPTIYEFHVAPPARGRVFELFEALLGASGAVGIETQSNGRLLAVMIHAYARDVASESILFADGEVTRLAAPEGARFRAATEADAGAITAANLDPGAMWLLELGDGRIVATGGTLFHYNRPYGDIFMAVTEALRRRGLGSYLVQEIKRTCYENGHVPAARCNVDNVASRRTLQRAGFVPCGHIVVGRIAKEA
jgi:GNAT superfamily N-acetyltransferase